MLSPEVCNKCRGGHAPINKRVWWHCPIEFKKDETYCTVAFDSDPPRWCPCKFEHAVAAGVKDARP